MRFVSHMPNYIDSDFRVEVPDGSIEDILNHEWVKGWNKAEREEFKYCWSPNDGQWSRACLMAEWIEDGKPTWWVLGYLSEIPTGLPQWICPEDSK